MKPSMGLRLLTAACSVSSTCSFAFAPNFITKIIAEQTNIAPQGLLEVNDDKANGASEAAALKANDKPDDSKTTIRTRFPPEPNGYLHVGHAKAVTFNFAVARMFGGKCNMRLDDTNPSKEDKEYVDSILEDVLWIQSGLYDTETPWDGPVRKTSDYFDQIYECAQALIESGDAFVDSLSAEEMREYRGTLTEPGKDSPYRNRSVQENIDLFTRMKNGVCANGEYVVRAKIAMDSSNINMRDPTLYRIKHESHPETGDTWCIYPMYDFSHPISDALEGITHSLCTLEFEDHRPFYDWTIQKLRGLGKLEAQPQQIEFSRLNIQSTVLSKRKLIQLVQNNHVNGWDDPRLPTLSGMRRRGVPPAALRLFCERVGISKADSNIAFSNLEDCVRETMDSICPRAFAVLNPLKVTITNWNGDENEIEYFVVDRHPKLDEMGTRTVPFGHSVYIERSDFFDTQGPEGKANEGRVPKGFKRLVPNGRVRLRNAYVIECNEIVRNAQDEPVELKCTYLPDTRAGVTPDGMERVNGIVHWVEASSAVRCTINQYDRLFATEEPGKDSGDFLQDINPDSLGVLDNAVVEPSVADDAVELMERISAATSDGKKIYASELAYQFERSGYFALDPASTEKEALVFNRVVTLRDTWGRMKDDKQEAERNRGGANARRKPVESAESIEDILRAALRAATIVSVKLHPEAENLLVCQVDCGDTLEDGEIGPPRTVVAGLAGKIPTEQLVGRKVVAVTNLKPSKMRGIESTAMLLAASDGKNGDDEKVELLLVPDSVPNGELLSFEGKEPSQPDPMLKSKGALKAWDRAKSGLRLKDCEAVYTDDSGCHRMLSSGGSIRAQSFADADIR